MNKSVLAIDTPENCLDCQFCYELDEGVKACCSIIDNDEDKSLMKEIDCEYGYCQGKPNWCPLKSLPEKMKVAGIYNNAYLEAGGKPPSYKIGWNDCIDAIAETSDKNER